MGPKHWTRLWLPSMESPWPPLLFTYKTCGLGSKLLHIFTVKSFICSQNVFFRMLGAYDSLLQKQKRLLSTIKVKGTRMKFSNSRKLYEYIHMYITMYMYGSIYVINIAIFLNCFMIRNELLVTRGTTQIISCKLCQTVGSRFTPP